ncbi:hypothetical protein ACA910_014181 [Epithemia clementina (nom. ined.)]
MTTPSSLLNSELYSTLHDRQRRNQRMIAKEDQLRARRYGMCEHGRNGRLKYTYNGKILIWCPYSNRAITCWNIPDSERGPEDSGTSHSDPILIQKSRQHALPQAEMAHTLVTLQIRNQKTKWKSHTVLVVDMSGSMRTDDVNGARCRSDGVWTCLAKEFVQKQVEQGKTSLHDLVSVVLMRDTAQVVLECEPMNYVLYNKLVDLREWTNQRPGGHGNYAPALEKAELLLNKNSVGSCAVALFFFSDGRPSDANKHELPAKMGALASRFGRRLIVTCVGMANHQTEDFTILQQMANEAMAYGAIATFHKPSMNADSLSQIISSQVTSSLTSTKTELTNLSTGKSLTVRTDLVRERHNAPDDVAPTDDWRLFNDTSTKYTVNVWTWNPALKGGQGDFGRLIDPRCAACYNVTVLDTTQTAGAADATKGMMCNSCKACFFCWTCVQNRRAGRVHGKPVCHKMATERRQGAFLPLKETCALPSFDVAWKQKCFGEGAERVAFKFRYLDDTGAFTGPNMVAKESRFIDNHGIEAKAAGAYLTTEQHQYHRVFMQTQYLASQFADKFNAALQEWMDHLDEIAVNRIKKYSRASQQQQEEISIFLQQCRYHKERVRRYPRIRFLRPHIFELVDKEQGKTFNVLVEPMIEGTYRKYNSNNGGLLNQPKFESPFLQSGDESINPSLVHMLLGSKQQEPETSVLLGGGAGGLVGRTANAAAGAGAGGHNLGAIEEGDSEEDDDDDDSERETDEYERKRLGTTKNDRHGGGGDKDDPRDFFERLVQEGDWADRKLTNATIPDDDFMQAFSHFSYVRSGSRLIVVDLQGTLQVSSKYGTREFVLTDPAIHKRKKSRRLKDLKFGRTDRGDKGIRDFFSTHTCNDACRLLGVPPQTNKKVQLIP